MMNFITENLVAIIIVAVFLAVIAFLFFAFGGKYRKAAKQLLRHLVYDAEERYGGGTGEVKYSYVTALLFEKLPALKYFCSEKALSEMIEDAVAALKKKLEDGDYVIAGKEDGT